MTDFYCPDCKKDVSSTAESCPHCGAAIPAKGWPEKWLSVLFREHPIIAVPLSLIMLAGSLILMGAVGMMMLALIKLVI